MLRPRAPACRSAAEQAGEEGLRPWAGAALVLGDVGQHLLDVAAASHPGRLAADTALDPGAHLNGHLLTAPGSDRQGTTLTISRRAESSWNQALAREPSTAASAGRRGTPRRMKIGSRPWGTGKPLSIPETTLDSSQRCVTTVALSFDRTLEGA